MQGNVSALTETGSKLSCHPLLPFPLASQQTYVQCVTARVTRAHLCLLETTHAASKAASAKISMSEGHNRSIGFALRVLECQRAAMAGVCAFCLGRMTSAGRRRFTNVGLTQIFLMQII